jgi:ribosomal protein S18 acetylase RimI-like enzyme
MMGGARVRPARPEDADFILALVPHLLAFGPPPWRDAAQMTETDTLTIARSLGGASDRATVLVAEDSHGKRLGFIHLCGEPDYYTRAECGHIADIVVAPEARGRGVGEALMAAGERWARDRGYMILTLNVFLENQHARALYERLGFHAETVRYVKSLR